MSDFVSGVWPREAEDFSGPGDGEIVRICSGGNALQDSMVECLGKLGRPGFESRSTRQRGVAQNNVLWSVVPSLAIGCERSRVTVVD